MSVWSAIALSMLATSCYQVGLLLQKLGADRLPRLELTLRQGRVFGAFFRSPLWLTGIAVTTAGWVCFLKAIAHAPVSLVQPVLGFGLCLFALFSVIVLREHLGHAEWAGIALMVGGIVLLGISGSGESHHAAKISAVSLVGVSFAGLALLAAAVPIGRSGRAVARPVVLGFGAGVLIGLAALYTKGLFLTLEAGLPALAWMVFLPLLLVANITGLWVQQAGFQQGRALIVSAMNAVTNKVVTIVGGMATLGELLPESTSLATARLVGFLTILVGTALLARFGEPTAVRVGKTTTPHPLTSHSSSSSLSSSSTSPSSPASSSSVSSSSSSSQSSSSSRSSGSFSGHRSRSIVPPSNDRSP